MAELWDGYDVDFKKIENTTLIRGQEIPQGVFHLVCDIAVRHKDGDYLLMQRDYRKPNGGMWELTACGSALQGETPLQCVIRELEEETGIRCQTVTELGRITNIAKHTIYVDYIGITDCRKDGIRLQEGETISYQWIRLSDLPKVRDLVTKRILLFLSDHPGSAEEVSEPLSPLLWGDKCSIHTG